MLTLWDLVIEVLDIQVAKNAMRHHNNNFNPKMSLTSEKWKNGGARAQLCRQEVCLFVFEDNDAVIKVIIKVRSLTARHVSRTHRLALDWVVRQASS